MRRSFLAAALGCAAFLGTTLSLADTAPADAIKYRKAVMSAMGAHIAGFSLINFGRIDHPEYLKAHVSALADMGAEGKALFPAGSGTGDTDALPLIWEEQDRFASAVSALEKSTAQLRDAVNANDKKATNEAFKAVGEACKGCHDRYRKEAKK